LKFACERCGKRFASVDEPEAGRVYRIRCRCGNVIHVSAADANGEPAGERRSAARPRPDRSRAVGGAGGPAIPPLPPGPRSVIPAGDAASRVRAVQPAPGGAPDRAGPRGAARAPSPEDTHAQATPMSALDGAAPPAASPSEATATLGEVPRASEEDSPPPAPDLEPIETRPDDVDPFAAAAERAARDLAAAAGAPPAASVAVRWPDPSGEPPAVATGEHDVETSVELSVSDQYSLRAARPPGSGPSLLGVLAAGAAVVAVVGGAAVLLWKQQADARASRPPVSAASPVAPPPPAVAAGPETRERAPPPPAPTASSSTPAPAERRAAAAPPRAEPPPRRPADAAAGGTSGSAPDPQRANAPPRAVAPAPAAAAAPSPATGQPAPRTEPAPARSPEPRSPAPEAGGVEHSPPEAREGLDPAVMEEIIARGRPELDACVVRALEDPVTSAYAGRKAALLILVAPNGRVEAAVEDGELDASPLGACLRRAAQKMSFPRFSGEDVGARVVLELGRPD
jgi:hypothetical protein